MKIRELADAVQHALLAFYTKSIHEDTEEEIRTNANISSYYIVELAKRFNERRYYEKTHGKELTIEEAMERSTEATTKFFARKQRRRAPREMRVALKDNAELLDFLEGEESEQPQEPEAEVDSGSNNEQNNDENGEGSELPEQPEADTSQPEPPAGSAPYPTVPTE